MANVKISALPSAAALTGSEAVPIVQSGATVKTTTGAIGLLQKATVVIPGATLLALTDVTVVAAPGAGKIINPHWWSAAWKAGTTNYSGSAVAAWWGLRSQGQRNTAKVCDTTAFLIDVDGWENESADPGMNPDLSIAVNGAITVRPNGVISADAGSDGVLTLTLYYTVDNAPA